MRQRTAILLVAICAIAVLVRLPPALQDGLWADEIFSLAIATGHSLEHPAEVADPEHGDYVEPPGPVPPATFRRYAEHGAPPAGPARVIRAVLLSDTSPPLYYLLVNLWTRQVGTSDAALRLFSLLSALVTLPLLWLLGRKLGGRRAAWGACLLFTFAPAAVYYSAEGRMYALTWLLGTALALATVQLARAGSRPWPILAWSVAAAAALLTHYFLGFVWIACVAWLVLHPGRTKRPIILAGVGLTGLLVLPWYLQLPASLSAWRVTGGWLDGSLSLGQALAAPVQLAWSLLSGRGIWGGSVWMDRFAAALFTALAGLVLWRGLRPMLTARRQLAWLWLLASVLGPVAFDLAMGTYTSTIARYALPGLPAAMLLGGLSIRRVPRPVAPAFVFLVLVAWLPGLRDAYSTPSRPWEPYPVVAERLDAWSEVGSLIVVHSIPSGVVGVARYLNDDTPMLSWVGQLDERRAGDMEAFAEGRCKTALVKIHDMGEPAPEEAWLRENARLQDTDSLHYFTSILYFAAPARSGDRPSSGCPASRTPTPRDPESAEPPAQRSGG